MELEFKPAFEERYKLLTDWPVFKAICGEYLRRSIRINTLKMDIPSLKDRLGNDWELTPIPWCKEGFWIKHKGGRRDVGNLIEHSLGYIYIQEAASMIPPVVLDPKPGETILDMCASPGSKTSQIAQYMENQGILVANDIKGDRLAALGINLQRCGITNSVITLMQGHNFAKGAQTFDRILVDAPCSGTGTIRKSLKTLRIWNPQTIKRLGAIQKQLLKAAFKILRPGGTLVYSTCSVEPQEDEAVISDLLQSEPSAKIQKIDLPLKCSPAVLEFEGQSYHPDVKHCLRLWPQDNDTEGFFVCKLTKVE